MGRACWPRGAIQRGATAVGLDFSAEAVDLARALVPEGDFRRGDAQALPFPPENFDAVLCGYGLMHLPRPSAAVSVAIANVRAAPANIR